MSSKWNYVPKTIDTVFKKHSRTLFLEKLPNRPLFLFEDSDWKIVSLLLWVMSFGSCAQDCADVIHKKPFWKKFHFLVINIGTYCIRLLLSFFFCFLISHWLYKMYRIITWGYQLSATSSADWSPLTCVVLDTLAKVASCSYQFMIKHIIF